MPSGAKKRKAAKKKKVQQSSSLNNNPISSSQSQGNDDAQHYDDKKSDGGSPSSQDHHSSEHSFAEGDGKEVEKKEGSSSGQSVVLEKSSLGGVSSGENVKNVATGDGIVQIEWELKSEEDYGSKEGSMESKEVHTGGSSGSSGSSNSSNSSRSSSDDESNVEKKTEVVETGHAFDSVEPVDSLSEVASKVDTNIPAGGNSNPVGEIVSVVTPAKASSIEEVVQVNGSASGGYPVTSSVGYKVEVQEHSDKGLPSSDDNTGISPVRMDLGSMKEADNTVSTSQENPAVCMDVKESVTEDKDDKLSLSFNAPDVHTSNGAYDIKESESPECSDSQPLVASAPQVVQKTSFKSCCGIFDLFTSSDR